MQLNVNDDRVLVSPSDEELKAAVRYLPVGEFLVLKRSDEFYIQTFRDEEESFHLEYRNGGAEQHFGVVSSTVTVHEVCQAFLLFANDFSSLASAMDWSPMVLDQDDTEPGEESDDEPMIEYQGVMMPESWRTEIDASQSTSNVSIAGKDLERIRFGSETAAGSGPNCGDCGVLVNQFHVLGCVGEQCPQCGGQLVSCDCEIDEGESVV